MKKFLLAVVAIAATLGAVACGNASTGGHKILFSILDLENPPIKLYTMNPDGSNLLEVYQYEHGDQLAPARLSDDGSSILLVDAYNTGSGNIPTFNYSLVTLNADGTNPITWVDGAEMSLTCIGLFKPQLSRDGSVLLYNQPKGDECTSDLYLSGTAQMNPQVVYEGGERPFSYLLSEDGNSIIVMQSFTREQAATILVVNRQTFKPVTLYDDPEDIAFRLVSVMSNRLYFITTVDASTFTLKMLDLSSGRTTTFFEGGGVTDVAVAPDGGSMLYLFPVPYSREDPLGAGCEFPDYTFGLYDFGTEKVTNLSCDQFPSASISYSYDGEYAYSATLTGNVFNKQGQVAFANDEFMLGVFSPDSHEFLYFKKSDSGGKCLHIRNLDNGKESILEESCQQRGGTVSLDWQ
jgi:hypothetical protein